MRKSSSKIREEIERLNVELKAAETKEAERIGRIALKSGLGDLEIGEAELANLFAEIAGRFRDGKGKGKTAPSQPARPAEGAA